MSTYNDLYVAQMEETSKIKDKAIAELEYKVQLMSNEPIEQAWQATKEQIAQLQAEVDALRGALERIIKVAPSFGFTEWAQGVANNVLANTGGACRKYG